ncbi:MAG: Gldg family protein [Planctomycetaceae bacterium]|nr:Gldg family protein [Planctomycetaceae bacterium]
MTRRHVIQAIFRRNFFAYFGSPTGYVFIAVFVALSAATAFWRDVFFTNNLANLDPLNRYFPFLLLFFIPAVAMAIWAEERKQGTDELLLTLPATDVEIVLGKYLSGLGIYSVALLFSLTNVVVLKFLGSPDIGVMIGTYLGYWFLGGALLAVAMAASLLTSSQTVAFILGALFCAVPVFLGNAGSVAGGKVQGWLESLGVDSAFNDLASGVVSLRAILYFVCMTAVFLYANLILLARRHTEKGDQWLHFGARTASLVVIGIALGVLANRMGGRVDLTQERLHTLTDPTRKILSKIDPGRPVYIQAYISPEVPESYVEQRETLLQLLKEVSAIGGDRIQLRIVETERYSPEARQAEDQFGIKAATVRNSAEGEEDAEGIFLGVAFTCGADSVVIPFFNRGLSVEYELTRSIGTVSGAQRRKIGVANTDAKIFGGLDFQTMSSAPEWEILAELKKQYDVVQVGLDTPITEKMDALLVAQVSSLTQAQMNILMAYLKQGGAALLFDDPFPQFNPKLAPGEPKSNPGRNQMMGMMPPTPSDPKGDIAKFCSDIGLQFPTETIIWDTYNPHPKLNLAPREILFVGQDRFNQQDPITSGLQEMVLLYGGELRAQGAMPLSFTPLLTTTPVSGGVLKSQLFQNSFFGMQRVDPQYRPRGQAATLAARIKGSVAPPAPPGGQAPPAPPATLNLIYVADLDCISNLFFQLRADAPEGLSFDNITFILNCVDVLAGDESYVELRKRRPKHRTLESFENLTKSHNQKMLDETKEAEEKAEKARSDAQARFDAKIEEVRKRTDFDERRKEMEVRNLQEVENKRLTAEQRKIDEDKKAAIERSKSTMKQRVSSIKKNIRNLAVFLAPIPALVMGLYMLTRRMAAQGRVS